MVAISSPGVQLAPSTRGGRGNGALNAK